MRNAEANFGQLLAFGRHAWTEHRAGALQDLEEASLGPKHSKPYYVVTQPLLRFRMWLEHSQIPAKRMLQAKMVKTPSRNIQVNPPRTNICNAS